ncbi:MAG: DUF4174 domain-containing protein [Candidatus Methylacidiphilales bacterium]
MKFMDPYKWKYRLVAGVVEDPDQLERLKKNIEAEPEGIKDRRLGFLILHGKEAWIHNLPEHQREPGWEVEMRARIKGDSLVLIGLDGGVKARYLASRFRLEEVFREIDSMPMRRSELEKR